MNWEGLSSPRKGGSCQKAVLLQKKNKSADLRTATAATMTETQTVTSDAATSPISVTNTSPAGHNLHQGVSSEVFNVFDFKDLAPVRSSWDLKIPDSIYNLLVLRSDSDKATLMTPPDAPLKLDKEDLRHLLPDKEIVGQVLDGILLVLMASARQCGVNVFSLPEAFFSRVDTDLTMEGCVPLDFGDIDCFLAMVHHPGHWVLLFVDFHKKTIFYLDPMYSLASSNRVRKDLDIVNRIIWHKVLSHDEDESVPETLDDWNYVTSTTFKYVLGQDLPKQTRGVDCGL